MGIDEEILGYALLSGTLIVLCNIEHLRVLLTKLRNDLAHFLRAILGLSNSTDLYERVVALITLGRKLIIYRELIVLDLC